MVIFSGCVNGPTRQYPKFPDQTKRVADPSMARVYLIRPKKGLNQQVPVNFYGNDSAAIGPRVDPVRESRPVIPQLGLFAQNPRANSRWRMIGQVAAGSYLCWEEPPHVFALQGIQGKTNSLFSLNLTAGNVYYLCASTPGFWMPRSVIESISEEEGLALLKESKPPDDYRNRNQK
jgi:hypothetical protein